MRPPACKRPASLRGREVGRAALTELPNPLGANRLSRALLEGKGVGFRFYPALLDIDVLQHEVTV